MKNFDATNKEFSQTARAYLEQEIGKQNKGKFMLLPLGPVDPNKPNVLRYFGLEEEIRLFPHEAWEELEQETIQLHDTIISQELRIPDQLREGTLEDYYKSSKSNRLQRLESSILNKYFDEKDRYLSLPIADKVYLHIVYKKELTVLFERALQALTTKLQNDYAALARG